MVCFMEKLGPLLWKLWVFCSSNEESLVSCPMQLLVYSRLESLPPLAGIKGELLFIYLYEYIVSNDVAAIGPFNLSEQMQN